VLITHRILRGMYACLFDLYHGSKERIGFEITIGDRDTVNRPSY